MFTPDDFKKLMAEAVSAANAPIVESVKELGTKVAVLERERQAPVFQQPMPQQQTATASVVIPKDIKTNDLPKDKFSILRLAKAQVSGKWDEARLEREVLDYCEKTLTWASGSGGGYWVAPEFLGNEFIEMLRAKSVCRMAGCTVWSGLNGSPVSIPRQSAGATFYWVAQDATITPSDQTPATATLTPHQCVGLTRISRIQAGLNPQLTEQIVRDDLTTGCGLAVDQAMLLGTGSSNQPTGIIADSSRNTLAIGTNGGTPTIDNFYTMLYELELDNVPTDRLAWFMHPRQWNSARLIKKNGEAANFSLQPDPTVGTPRSLLGFPVYLTTAISITLTKGTSTDCSHIFLVRVPDLVLGEWGGIQLEATTVGGNAWNNNLMEIKVTYVVDTFMRYSSSACTCSDARA